MVLLCSLLPYPDPALALWNIIDKVLGLTPVGMAGVQAVQGGEGKGRRCSNCCNEICWNEGKKLDSPWADWRDESDSEGFPQDYPSKVVSAAICCVYSCSPISIIHINSVNTIFACFFLNTGEWFLVKSIPLLSNCHTKVLITFFL